MKITDEMVEAACAAHWDAPWPGDRSEHILMVRRTDMRMAIAAAVAAAPTQEDRTYAALETIVVPDNGTTEEVLTAVLACAKAWEPAARIIGNVRAGDIARAVEAALSAQPQTVKPLEWNPYRAETPFGWYEVNDQRDVPEHELKGRPPFLLWGSRLDYSRHATLEEAKAAAQADYEARIRAALTTAPAQTDEELYEIGKRDGYEEAVQEIDQLTGGDGEYRYCTNHDPERHTPGPVEMIQRIVDRFETLNSLNEAQKDGRDQEWGNAAAPSQEPGPVCGVTRAEDCVLSIGSTRVCGYGTLGCVNHHAPFGDQEPAQEPVYHVAETRMGYVPIAPYMPGAIPLYPTPPDQSARIAELEAALKPFAEKADRYNDIPGVVSTADNVQLWQIGSAMKIDITVGELRNARAALKGKGE